MKRDFTATVGAAVLTLSMATLPFSLPANAQVDTVPRTDGTTTRTYDRTAARDGFDWGWLGLIGLLGLAGLAGKKRDDEPTRYRDPSAPGASSYRE
ncbi:WGxxGxxG family protein [Anabaena subtropica]|uniref:WGxxGxxG-CTERM domain-containing protein n=1 Tax=Anabaena subtropica FACHB-260 TaxID=2692884 RepID=A0ABR8CT49_9NOST|nr:WGxxGxxG family protein [Anabaena subtropica]MBD2346366.1 WGxxGxxG-CTERM domain-containing protein [Anabaena subtropica FACHB-260]